jgi:hypothetical protein
MIRSLPPKRRSDNTCYNFKCIMKGVVCVKRLKRAYIPVCVVACKKKGGSVRRKHVSSRAVLASSHGLWPTDRDFPKKLRREAATD